MDTPINIAAVLQPDLLNPLPIRSLFGRDAPLEVDIGCGKGRFLMARASAHPETDFLGIDRMLRRVRVVEKKTRRFGLTNVRILRLEASYVVEHLLSSESVSTFYAFFPDPWPKRRHHRRRLFTGAFLDALHTTLVPDGHIHIATDHADYFEVMRRLFDNDSRFKEAERFELSDGERTEFEQTFTRQGAKIQRVSYRGTPSRQAQNAPK